MGSWEESAVWEGGCDAEDEGPELSFSTYHVLGLCQVYSQSKDRPSRCPQGVDILVVEVPEGDHFRKQSKKMTAAGAGEVWEGFLKEGTLG